MNKIVTVYASEITKANIFSAGTVSGYKAIEDDSDKIAVSDNGTITVSYTHLDVYKRQDQDQAGQ